MTIGERIRQKRLELGLTQDELAKLMGYKSRAAISNVEKDKEDLTSTRIRKFAEVLGTTPALLMGWDDEQIPGLDDLPSTHINDDEIDLMMRKYFQALGYRIYKDSSKSETFCFLLPIDSTKYRKIRLSKEGYNLLSKMFRHNAEMLIEAIVNDDFSVRVQNGKS